MSIVTTSRPHAPRIGFLAALALVAGACARREALVPPTSPPPASPPPAAAPARPLHPCSADGRVDAAISRAAWAVVGPDGGAVAALATEPGTLTAYAGSDGVWKTTDGRTWTRASAGLTGSVRSLATHPRSRGTVFAATDEGLYESTDGAATWELLPGPPLPGTDPVGRYVPYSSHGITAVAAAPWVTGSSPAGTLLAGTDGLGLWRSADAGATWQRAALAPATTVRSIAFDPARPDVAYAVGVQAARGWIGAVYRSTDGGVQWSMTTLQGQPELREVFVDPTLRDVVYAGGPGLFESRDGGATWEKVLNAGLLAFAAHDDGRAHVRFAGAVQGVYRKAAGEGGWTMDPPESGMPPEAWARGIAVGANGLVLAATRSGILASSVRGRTWRRASTGLHEAYVEKLGVGPAGSGIVYAAHDGVHRSLDGGATWTRGVHPDETQLFTAIAVEQRHRSAPGSRAAAASTGRPTPARRGPPCPACLARAPSRSTPRTSPSCTWRPTPRCSAPRTASGRGPPSTCPARLPSRWRCRRGIPRCCGRGRTTGSA